MIDVYGFFKKVPGGALLIPMLLAALINTAFPTAIATLGGTSLATFKGGTMTIVGVILFAAGANTHIKTLGLVLKRNGALALAKLLIGFGFGIAFVRIFGLDGIMGISAVAFVTCVYSCNPGVYIGLVQDYGEQTDMGNIPIMNMLNMPVIPLLILATGGAKFQVMEVLTILVPYVLGIVLGNLDPKLAKMFSPMSIVILPFLGLNFGFSINLLAAAKAGLAGVVLGLVYMAVNVPFLLLTDRAVNKRPGYSAAAMCSLAGFSVVVPSLLGESFSAYQPSAIPQIVMCMVVTSILCPLVTKLVVNKWGAPRTLAQSVAAGGK